MGRVLVFVVLASCGPSPNVDAGSDARVGCGFGPGELEVGSGGSRLRAIRATANELPIVLGSQGGIHLVVGAWVRDVDLNLVIRYRLEDPADGSLIGLPTEQRLAPSLFAPAGPRFARHPDLLVLNNDDAPVAEFDGRTAELVAEIQNDESYQCDRRTVVLNGMP